MDKTVIRNSNTSWASKARRASGFTLVEVMVALVVLALGLLGSITGIMAALDTGIRDEIRNEAVKIAQQQEEKARNLALVNYANLNALQQITVTRQVRDTLITYTVTPTVTPVSLANGPEDCSGHCGASTVAIQVTWMFKGVQTSSYSYVLQTIVRQAQ